MDFRHLQSFITLAEELHFGRAAARLHLSQPSLSAQLQKLEKSLDVTLVERTSHEVRLTPSGVQFAAHARVVLAQMDKAVDIVQSTAAGHTGTLTIGYNFPASAEVLPAVLHRLTQRHPHLAVSLCEQRTGPQLAGVQDGSLDIALVYGHPHLPGLAARRVLARVPIVAIVGRTHPFAGRSSVRWTELATERCVLFGREQCPAMYDAIFSAAAAAGVSLTVAHISDDPGGTGHLVYGVGDLEPVTALGRHRITHRGDERPEESSSERRVHLDLPRSSRNRHGSWPSRTRRGQTDRPDPDCRPLPCVVLLDHEPGCQCLHRLHGRHHYPQPASKIATRSIDALVLAGYGTSAYADPRADPGISTAK